MGKYFYDNYDRDNNKYMIESVYLNLLKNQKFQGNRSLNQGDHFKNPKVNIESHGVMYSYNNYGFREDDFLNCADILIAGCSQTWGVGIPKEYRFSNVIQKNTTQLVHNISFPGNSVSATVRLIFAYIKQFGNPKSIYCMMPPFERFEVVPNIERFLLEDIHQANPKHRDSFSPILVSTYSEEYDKIQRAPFTPEHTINLESIHFWQAQSLLMLEQYCKATNINFAWSTWSTWCGMPDTIIDLKNRGLGYETFIDIPFRKWKYDYENYIDKIGDDCHQDLNNEYPEIFHAAMDRYKYGKRTRVDSNAFAHWGSHRNAHVAEIVLKYMKENWGI